MTDISKEAVECVLIALRSIDGYNAMDDGADIIEAQAERIKELEKKLRQSQIKLARLKPDNPIFLGWEDTK